MVINKITRRSLTYKIKTLDLYGETYFTSDTHFGSLRTLTLSKRPYNTVKDMDESLIRNWNDIVNNEDIVYHLGDFGDYKTIKKLNGNVILVCGNYERTDIKKGDNTFHEFRINLIDLGFYDVYEKSAYFSNNLINVPMTHCPEDCNKNVFNLFGHIHKLCMVKKYGLNVGTDSHHFKPIDLDTVLFYKNAIDNLYDNNVFE